MISLSQFHPMAITLPIVQIRGFTCVPRDKLDAKLISETNESPHSVFFSPDSQWIGYASDTDDELKKVPISGGLPITLCNAQLVIGASWSSDNTILYGEYGKGIFQVPANGGTPKLLFEVQGSSTTSPARRKNSDVHRPLQVKPNSIVVQSLESGERKPLFEGSTPYYFPSGHIVYNWKILFMLFHLTLTDLKVQEDRSLSLEGVICYAISNSGTLVYIPGKVRPTVPKSLIWVDLKGNEEPLEQCPELTNLPKYLPMEGM